MTEAAPTQANEIQLNRHQFVQNSVDRSVSIADLSGRGCGKSFGFALLMLRGVEEHGRAYRALYLRKSYKGLKDFETILLEVFNRAYTSKGFKYNQTDHVLNHPSGAYLELGELGDARAYEKVQGRSFVEIFVDECQQFAEPRLIDLLRSNLRSATTPTRLCLAANPLGPGHHWLKNRYIDRAPPGQEFQLDGVPWVRLTGTYRDNSLIDRDSYAKNIRAATVGDKARREAWLDGRFDVDSGSYFSGVFSERRSVLDFGPDDFPSQHLWEWELAHDWGYSAPSVTLLLATAMDGLHGPNGRFFPRGSVIVCDEVATTEGDSISAGLGLTVPEVSERIHEMLRVWRHAKPRGRADDAITAPRGDQPRTFQQEFERCGINFRPAKKGERIPSLARLARFLADAGSVEEPGLYINRRCRYLLKTLPLIQRDESNPEDLDRACDFDHGVDALRYGLTPDRSSDGWCVFQSFDI